MLLSTYCKFIKCVLSRYFSLSSVASNTAIGDQSERGIVYPSFSKVNTILPLFHVVSFRLSDLLITACTLTVCP